MYRTSYWLASPCWACWVALVIFPADSAQSQSLRDLIAPVGSSRASSTSPPHPSVARIIVPERGGTSYGSGSLIDVHREYAIVITNWHVVADRVGDVSVQFPDGFQSAGKVLKVDKDWDLAAIGIWRPNVEPMRFAERAPVIGEPLAIAGYGPGQWRLASGRCTQFVSPGSSFPPDMVEVSVEARQGDSGGPILNQQGDIAGVLFGAGRGATSGSNAPRVKLFLESVFPILREAPDAGLAANRDSAVEKPPVVVNADWNRSNSNLGGDTAKASALRVEERSPDTSSESAHATAPLVAAKPTPSRATDAELKDWIAPASAKETRTELNSRLSDTPLRGARIHRAQLVDASASHGNSGSTGMKTPGLVEPQEQADCAKFDPAFPSLSGGVEGETYSLVSTEAVDAHSQPSTTTAAPRAGLFDQGKTFLALLGVVTILFQLGKMLGGKAS